VSRAGRDEDPDRLYTLTGGRSRPDSDSFDLVTLIVTESQPTLGMQSEYVAILELCRAPTAVVEVAAELRLPVGIAMVLLSDLLDMGKISVRHPQNRPADPTVQWYSLPDTITLEKVLVGLRNL
jgi:hypothetical protein